MRAAPSANDTARLPLLLLLAAAFAACMLADVLLLWPHASLLESYDTVPDEMLFHHQASRLASSLGKGDWGAVAGFGTPYGYGFAFWLSAALLVLLLPDAALHGLALHKLAFLVMKWGALVLLVRAVWRRQGPWQAVFLGAAFLSCSAFWFYGKVLSPEFETLALAALALWLVWRDEGRLGAGAHVALAAAWCAVSIKATSAPILLMVGGYLLVVLSRQPSRTWLRTAALLSVTSAATLLVCCLPLLDAAGRETFLMWSTQNIGRSFSIGHAADWLRQRSTTWDLVPLSGAPGYAGLGGALILGWVLRQRVSGPATAASRIAVTSGLAGLALVVCANGYLDWYLWVPAVLVLGGCAMQMSVDTRAARAGVVGVALLALLVSLPETARRVGLRRQVLQVLDESARADGQTRRFFADAATACGPVVPATDLLIAAKLGGVSSAGVLRMRDLVTRGVPRTPTNGPLLEAGMLSPRVFDPTGPQAIAEPADVTHLVVNTALQARGLSSFAPLGMVDFSPDRDIASFAARRFHKVAEHGNRAIYEDEALACRR